MATIVGTVEFSGYSTHISWISTDVLAYRREVPVYASITVLTAFSGRSPETPTNPYWGYIELSDLTRLRSPQTVGYGGTPISGSVFTSAVIVPYGGVTR